MELGAAVPPRVAWAGRRGEGGGQDQDDDVSDQDQDQNDADDDVPLLDQDQYEEINFPIKGDFGREALQGRREGGSTLSGLSKYQKSKFSHSFSPRRGGIWNPQKHVCTQSLGFENTVRLSEISKIKL